MNKSYIIKTRNIQKFFIIGLFIAVALTTYYQYTLYDESRITIFNAILPSRYVLTLKDINDPNLAQDSPELIKLIRENFLIHPPPPGQEYKLKNPKNLDPSDGQSKRILSVLNNKTGGFFIEVGGLDGETRSNTLYMERFLGWEGLLIEAAPSNFVQLEQKMRHAWLAPVCVSLFKYPTKVTFLQNWDIGHIVVPPSKNVTDPEIAKNKEKQVEVQCIPIYSLLLAIKRTKVDYFSLDVEGHEMEVLKTIPFDLLDIQTFSIEFRAHTKDAIKEFMEKNGYIVESIVANTGTVVSDFIFVTKV